MRRRKRSLGKEYNQSNIGMITFWKGVMSYNFLKVKSQYRVSFILPFVFGWTIFLQLKSHFSREKKGTDASASAT